MARIKTKDLKDRYLFRVYDENESEGFGEEEIEDENDFFGADDGFEPSGSDEDDMF